MQSPTPLERQENARTDALLAMREMSVKVLWDRVVERGRGLNYRVHGSHDRYVGVADAVSALLGGGQ